MSSTSRGAVRSENDFYETQRVDALPMLVKLRAHLPPKPSFWEPTAGRGALVRLLREQFPDAYIEANEIDADRAKELESAGADRVTNFDLFDVAKFEKRAGGFDCAFTNPPFFCATQVAERLFPACTHTVLLQRVNWLASLDRVEFWRQHAADAWLLPKRPSFAASLKCGRVDTKGKPDPCGWKVVQYLDSPRPRDCPGTFDGAPCQAKVLCTTNDSIEYAWFHFHPDSLRQYGHLGRIETAEQGDLLKGVA